MVKMKMKFGVFLLPLIFFNFFQQQINGEIKDNACQNWTETLQDQNLTEVTKPNLYRIHQNMEEDYNIYLGNEPFTIWMDLKDQTVLPINARINGFPQGNNPKWLKTTFPTSDYTHLKSEPNEVFKNENGISSVRLNSDGDTVVWIEVKDSAPEHFVIIKPKDGSQTFKEDVQIGLEANGLQPVSFDLEKNFTEIPNGIKIYLKKVICTENYNFLGHIRYIFNVNSTTNFTATFYDSNGTNIELKYLEEEKNGIPKPYSSPYKFEFFNISVEPPPTTTTTSTSTITPTSPIDNIPNEIDETPTAAPMVQPQNEIPSKAAAEIHGFVFSVLIALFMVQKLFVLFL